MSNTINITVEDIDDVMDTYTSIQVERSTSSPSSGFALIDTITLVADTYHYATVDASGLLTYWYRYRYHSGSADSNYSIPYQIQGISRLRLRQFTMKEYGIGEVLVASNFPGDVNTINTTSYKYKNTAYQTGRGQGTWIKVATGTRAGEVSNVLATSSPSAGNFELSPDLTGALASGDQFEWHKLVDPGVFDDCINKALQRYWFLDRVPLVGDNATDDWDMSFIPWLQSERWIFDVWYYPNDGLSISSNIQAPWGSSGQWWQARKDGDTIKLSLFPRLTDGQVVYIEACRQMPELHTDDSVLPLAADMRLCAALTYDEILAELERPVFGSSEDKRVFVIARERHQPRLKSLLRLHRIAPKFGPPQQSEPSGIVLPYSSR